MQIEPMVSIAVNLGQWWQTPWQQWRVIFHIAADRNITIGCWRRFGGKTEADVTQSKIVWVMVALMACK